MSTVMSVAPGLLLALAFKDKIVPFKITSLFVSAVLLEALPLGVLEDIRLQDPPCLR